jgi:hypothetical protein
MRFLGRDEARSVSSRRWCAAAWRDGCGRDLTPKSPCMPCNADVGQARILPQPVSASLLHQGVAAGKPICRWPHGGSTSGACHAQGASGSVQRGWFRIQPLAVDCRQRKELRGGDRPINSQGLRSAASSLHALALKPIPLLPPQRLARRRSLAAAPLRTQRAPSSLSAVAGWVPVLIAMGLHEHAEARAWSRGGS